MPCNTKAPTIRWFYLTIGILSMLFAGILYSWSILKAPLADAFGWNASQLTMNFTLTMCFFCLGGVGGGLLARRLGTRLTIALGGALACIGFVLTARLDGSSLPMLYLSYGVITATGIGFAYNVVLSTVQAWFPDKKGTCSGALLMGGFRYAPASFRNPATIRRITIPIGNAATILTDCRLLIELSEKTSAIGSRISRRHHIS